VPGGLRVAARWVALFLAATACAGEWRQALPGWVYEFPRDHASHPGFKTEWWYLTGNLTSEKSGRQFGYQLTFFRQGVIPPAQMPTDAPRFIRPDLALAHFAISDLGAGSYHFAQRLSRGAWGESGFGDGGTLAWNKGWKLVSRAGGGFGVEASDGDVSLALSVEPEKPPVIHGKGGVSQKSAGEGRASHYYSLTRLGTDGELRVGGETWRVSGLSWFDHEWATNQLAADQVGWDWFSIQFDDGTELMLFQIRKKDGGRDAFSSGTFVDSSGDGTVIACGDFSLGGDRPWRSPRTASVYPMHWKISVHPLQLELDVAAAMDDQELALDPVAYWEGSIRVTGTKGGVPIKGRGYLEMTGYGKPVVGLQSRE